MTIRVGEVKRFADVVVGEAHEWHAIALRVCEPAGEIDTLRKEEREVVEPVCQVAGWAPGASTRTSSSRSPVPHVPGYCW